MVLYNWKGSDGAVHIKKYTSSKMICGTSDILRETRENPTCEKCLQEIKYAFYVAKYLAKGGYGS